MAGRISRRLVKALRDSRGTNIMEAAIITPLLLLLTFAIADFGAMLYVDLALQNGVSQATRYAVTGNLEPNLDRSQSIMSAMRKATPTLTIADSAFTFSHMPVGGAAFVGGPGNPEDIEKVTVDYYWQIMTPVIKPFFPGGKIHFQVASSMKNEGRFN
jgi:Flp pilus assembly protein TadG